MNPYEPVTVPSYQWEALQRRCAQLEEETAALEKASGFTAQKLAALFMQGYTMCYPGRLPISKNLEANGIRLHLDFFPPTVQHLTMQSDFYSSTATDPGQLYDFLWRQL